MKNFNYICLSLVLVLFACTKEVGMQENLTTNKIEVNTDGMTIDAQRAINSLFSILNEINETDGTRSGDVSYRIINQELVEMRDIVGVTRADDNTDLCAGIDNNFYIVNFEDDKGRLSSAVLGANENLPPVLAIMNGGDLSSADFQKAWQKMQNETTANPLSASLVTDVEENTAPLENIISFLSLPPATPGDKPILTPGTGDDDDGTYTTSYIESYDWVTREGIGPLMYSHYDQETPFNDLYDINPNNNKRYYAGCGIVALAQILTHNKLERGFGPNIIDNTPIIWYRIGQGALKQDIEYYKKLDKIKTTDVCTSDECEEFAKLHRAIYNSIDTLTLRPDGAVGITKANARNFMIDCGYLDVIDTCYSDDFIDDMLIDRRLPVYTRGSCSACGGGHAWVIDGKRRCVRFANVVYVEYENNVEVNRYGVSQATDDEDVFLHCNWGYAGARDGYFLSGVFSSHNAVTRSCGIDDYSVYNYIILYNLHNQ